MLTRLQPKTTVRKGSNRMATFRFVRPGPNAYPVPSIGPELLKQTLITVAGDAEDALNEAFDIGSRN